MLQAATEAAVKHLESKKEKKHRINPNIVASEIISENRMFYYGEIFFRYNGGKYITTDSNHIKQILYQKLRNEYSPTISNNIMDCMIAQSLVDSINTSRGVNLKNGVYNLETGILGPHDPGFRFTTQVQASYDPNAKCDKWESFLSEMLGDDPAKIDIIQEYLGYCLDYSMSLEKVLFFLGRGANGKSVICDVFKSILGAGNYETLSLDDLKNKNYLADLLGKLVNISTESEARAEVYESNLKRLASAEEIKAERKFKDPFTFKSNCKHLYCLNNLPHVTDRTDAFFRRIIPIPFNQTVQKENRILKLGHIIAEEESSGILNWMIAGYNRLKSNKWNFTESNQVENLLSEYRMDNNNALSFVNECCVFHPDTFLSNTEAYERYKTWCKDSGLKPFSQKKLLSEIRHYYNLSYSVEGSGYEKVRGTRGLRLANQFDGNSDDSHDSPDTKKVSDTPF